MLEVEQDKRKSENERLGNRKFENKDLLHRQVRMCEAREREELRENGQARGMDIEIEPVSMAFHGKPTFPRFIPRYPPTRFPRDFGVWKCWGLPLPAVHVCVSVCVCACVHTYT